MKKGISLVALIITIVVIIILAGITIFYGVNVNLNKANFTKQYTEMEEVSNAITQRGLTHEISSELYEYVGTDLGTLANAGASNVGGYTYNNGIGVNNVVYGDGYYLICTAGEKEELGLEKVTGDYIVNYTTGEIVSIKPIEYEGKNFYTFSDIQKELAKEGEIDAEYSTTKGVNIPMLSDGMIPVIYDDGTNSWTVVSEDDTNWYDYSSTSKRWANIMLMDELTTRNYTNAQIRAMTRAQIESNLTGEKVTNMGSMFVWIPRYTYKVDGSNISVVYSNLNKDYIDNGYIKHPAFYFGGYSGGSDTNANTGYSFGGTELAGIWVSKYEAGFLSE